MTVSFQNTPKPHSHLYLWLDVTWDRHVTSNHRYRYKWGSVWNRGMRHDMSAACNSTPDIIQCKKHWWDFAWICKTKHLSCSTDCSDLTSRRLMVLLIKYHLFPVNCLTERNILLTVHSWLLFWFSAQWSSHFEIRIYTHICSMVRARLSRVSMATASHGNGDATRLSVAKMTRHTISVFFTTEETTVHVNRLSMILYFF